MRFWGNLVGYQLVWFAVVIGAGHGNAWPGVAAALAFVGWQLALSSQRSVELRLLATALLLGMLVDGALAASGLMTYAAAWPSTQAAPVWILAMWAAFAMTLTQSFVFLRGRPRLALVLGAIGGPLAYLGAARGWGAVTLQPPQWSAVVVLAVGWGIALPLLSLLAHRWSTTKVRVEHTQGQWR